MFYWLLVINCWTKDDETENFHYKKETSKLWNFSISHEEFIFKTIDEILNENEEMKNEIGRLNDVISDNITELNLKLDKEIEDRTKLNLELDKEIEERTELNVKFDK